MILLLILIISLTQFITYLQASSCKQFPSDIVSCIQESTGQCFWNRLTDSCEPLLKVNFGCDSSLNRLSCVRQLVSPLDDTILKKCYFGQRCQDVSSEQLNILGCSPNLSKFACLFVSTPGVKCEWYNDICSNLTNDKAPIVDTQAIPRCVFNSSIFKFQSEEGEEIQYDEIFASLTGGEDDENEANQNPGQINSELCEQNLNKSVNLNVCADLDVQKVCNIYNNNSGVHGRLNAHYECVNVNVSSSDFLQLKCNTLGLNRYGCLSISTPNQSCSLFINNLGLFNNGSCQALTVTNSIGLSCNSSINRKACLGFTDPSQTCQWNSSNMTCQQITNFNIPCESLVNVSVSTCAASTDQCVYNSTKQGCRKSNSSSDVCSAKGLSQSGCYNLTKPCRYSTKCQGLTPLDLFYYGCGSNLNQASCYAIQTSGQLCQWSILLQKCYNLNINATQNCTSFQNVNGNVCQAVTLDGCKYNSSSYACIKSLAKDSCTTPFLNIGGCVQVTRQKSICQWIENAQQCQNIKVISGITRCNDLRNVNSAACTLVYRPELSLDERNCKYSASSRGCITYAQFDPTSDCKDLGMNQYGCVNVIKLGSRCKWQNNACVAILKPVQVQSQYCITLQQVNAATCSLAQAGGEMCKYEPTSSNCITTVNVRNDNCNTVGLNSYGCGALLTSSCYFSSKSEKCITTGELDESDLQQFYNTATCTGTFLTISNCLNVRTPGQTCHWSRQQNICSNQQFTTKDSCLKFISVNSNTCAAVFNTVILSSSYCYFDESSQNCLVQSDKGKPCNTPGFNVHSCSAMTDESSYCYFSNDEGRCVQYGSADNQKTVSQVQTQWSQLQIACGSLNKKGCGLNIWNINQKCFYNNICYQFDFNNQQNPSQYNCAYFTNNIQTQSSPFLCSSVVTAQDYCMYNAQTGRCQSVINSQPCSTQYQNMHSCMFKTTNDFCQWDPLMLKCNQIAVSDQIKKVCTDPINQNLCTKVKSQSCQFTEALSLCSVLTPVTSSTLCTDLANTGMTYNPRSCAEIIQAGQQCSYRSTTRQCRVQIKPSLQCDNLGFNKGSCFAMTLAACQWNPILKQCFDLLQFLQQTQGSMSNVKCSDGVNKKVCLRLITGDTCQWDTVLGQCSQVVITSSTNCADLSAPNILYNSLSCRRVSKSGQNCIYDSKNSVCTNMAQTSLFKCTGNPININSCLQYSTNSLLYCNWDTINSLCSTVTVAQLNSQQCTDPVNKNICLDTYSGSCTWNVATLQCATQITTNSKCSDFATTGLYNRHTCTSLSYTQTVPANNAQCANQRDYCSYSSTTKLCVQLFRQSVNANNVGCSDVTDLTQCFNTLNYDACIHITSLECNYNGVCQDSAGLYNTMTCSQANYLSCGLITTPNQKCIFNPNNELCEVYPGTNTLITDPKQICYITYPQIATIYVNANVCSAIIGDHCVWAASTYSCTKASSTQIYLCSNAGLNKPSCLDYTGSSGCTFNSNTNQCSGITVIYSNCADVNGQATRQSLCTQVTKQGCYFDTNTQLCIQIQDPKANACPYAVNLLGCTQSNHLLANGNQDFCQFDTAYQACYSYTAASNAAFTLCSNLNKFACMGFTATNLLCVWVINQSIGSCHTYQIADLQSSTQMALVGDCINVSNQACLKVVVLLQCKLVGGNSCMDVTSTDTNNMNCNQMTNVNSLVCASFTFTNKVKQYCYFQQGSSALTSSCVQSGTNLDCGVAGLNIFSCIELTWQTNSATSTTTGPQCEWNAVLSQCQTITDFTYYDLAMCSSLNRIACPNNRNPIQPCVWSSSSTSCNFVDVTDPSVGPIICSNYASQIVSNTVCASAKDSACKQNTATLGCYVMQTSDSALTDCKNLGINRIGCLSQTAALYCLWNGVSKTCDQYDELVQYHCTDELNSNACINKLPLTCDYNKQSYKCGLITVNSATTFGMVSDSNYLFNSLTCQQFSNGLNSVAYDLTNQICTNVDGTSNKCSRTGLNQLGCLVTTSEPCEYDVSNGCIAMDNFDFNFCNQYFSLYTCTSITMAGCDFYKNSCQNVDYTVSTCASLSLPTTNINTNSQACARTIDGSYCKYDAVNLLCINVPNQETQCAVLGLNQYGCINQTPNIPCIFDAINFQCLAQNNINTYFCTQPLNQANCVSVTTIGQMCQFTNFQCSSLSTDVTTVCPTTTLVNPQVCVSITKSGETCLYNAQTNMCGPITPDTECTQPNMNKNGCLMNANSCYFSVILQKCSVANVKLLRCSDPISLQACTTIKNVYKDVCVWNSGSCGFVTNNTLSCSQLQLVNSPKACTFASDACRFDTTTTNACISLLPTDGPFLCNQIGLNSAACSQNTKEIKTCLFDNGQCHLPLVYTQCQNARNSQDCIFVVNLCQWLNNLCIPYTKTVFACDSSVPNMTTKYVCRAATLSSPEMTCNRNKVYGPDGVTVIFTSCVETAPLSCFLSYDFTSCVHLVGMPCVWNPNLKLCQLVQMSKYPGIYKCDDLGVYAGQRTCQDLKRIGEYCVYNQQKCQRIDPSALTTYCNSSINIDACVSINSNNQQCYWEVFTNYLLDTSNILDVLSPNITVMYTTGTCKNLTSPQTTICSSNLNIYACLAVTTLGQYCQWLGYLCSQIQMSYSLHPPPILVSQLTLVNSNACTLVNEEAQAVKYDPLNYGCVYSNPLIDQCLTPGLNQAACLKITNQSCSWNQTTQSCSVYAQVNMLITSCSQIQTNVNSKVCSQIQIPGLLCIYDSINQACADLSSFPLATCKALGLNKIGCLSLQQDSCSWLNETCHSLSIVPDLTSCQGVPFPTNSYSCQQVSFYSQLCKYDAINQKCVAFDQVSTETCLTRGLNLHGCISIVSDSCTFTKGYCKQFSDRSVRCRHVGIANPNTCSLVNQPVDSCKFDYLNSVCTVSNSYDVCSTPGINKQGCNTKDLCDWQDSTRTCQCTALQVQQPSCFLLNNSFDCKSRKDCYFIANQNNRDAFAKLNFNLTEKQQELVILGTCKTLTCSDMTIELNQNITKGSSNIQCDGINSDPHGTMCFFSPFQNQCISISNCEDIKLYDLNPYDSCKNYFVKGRPCLDGNNTNTCRTLSCSLLTSKKDCKLFNKYCIYTIPSCQILQPQCLEIQCEDLSQQNCTGKVNSRTCYWDNKICRGLSTCEDVESISNALVNKESTCNQMKQGNRQCGWVQTSIIIQKDQCSPTSCRYVGFSKSSCQGVHVGGEVCVFIQSNCLSCEEITDSCTCLNNAPFCAYDSSKSQCSSVPCSTYQSKSQCQDTSLFGLKMCQYSSETMLCSPLCSKLFSKTVCDAKSGCQWLDTKKMCQVAEIVVPKIKVIIPLAVNGLIWKVACILNFLTVVLIQL